MSGPGYCGSSPSRPFAHLLTEKDVARFRSKVDDSGGPEACWPWMRAKIGPYGQFGVHGRCLLSHRLAWTIAHGEIPSGRQVLHRCDNPPCCNPAHLFLGTQADNMADRAAKGRVRRGRKLTPEQVLEIRSLAAAGMTLSAIGKRVGASESNVCQVVRYRTHRDVALAAGQLPSENGDAA